MNNSIGKNVPKYTCRDSLPDGSSCQVLQDAGSGLPAYLASINLAVIRIRGQRAAEEVRMSIFIAVVSFGRLFWRCFHHGLPEFTAA